MKIVAIGYKKGRGKDSFANFSLNYLQSYCNCQVRKVGFADKLKDVCHQLYSWAGLKRGVYYEEHYDEKEVVLPNMGVSPRDIWIGVGNQLRAFHEGTWIDYVVKSRRQADILLVKDLGFLNEALAIREAGGLLVKMVRDGEMAADGRETELDVWDDWDAVIDNTGTLEQLNEFAVEFCKEKLL